MRKERKKFDSNCSHRRTRHDVFHQFMYIYIYTTLTRQEPVTYIHMKRKKKKKKKKVEQIISFTYFIFENKRKVKAGWSSR
jgi:hypothetical protein